MVKKRNAFLLLVVTSMLITGCGVVSSSGPRVTVPPEDPSSSIFDSGEISNNSINSDGSNSTNMEDHIEIIDENPYYYVGETFLKAFRPQKAMLYYQGTERDISLRSTGFDFILKDDKGNVVDHTKPFTKAGNYHFQMYLSNRTSIVSNIVNIVVKESPKNVFQTKTEMPSGFTYYDFENSCLDNLSLPSIGNINCLVIPVEVSDYPFTDIGYGANYMDSIDKLFNGNGAADTGYYESIASYYHKSSLGKLNINFEIANVYECGLDSASIMANGTYGAFLLGEKAIENFKTVNGDSATVKFDNDHDGFIDGLWMIYSAPDYSTGAYGDALGSDVFWAFCSDITWTKANMASPNIHSFGWASADFMFEGTEVPNIDCHTFCHETGHLLSLPDYYSYSMNGVKASGAQGGLAMMDLNIGDQDSFSKLSLGWSSPYVVTDDCIVKIKPNTSSNECIILADSFNGTAFDEYIIIDLVVPTGLNELDSKVKYNWRPMYYSEIGVRMYHIDARLGAFVYMMPGENHVEYEGIYPYMDESKQTDYYLTDDMVRELVNKGSLPPLSLDQSVYYKGRNPGYRVINSNSTNRCLIDQTPYTNNRLIALISADNKVCELDDYQGNNASLFKAGDSWTVNGQTLRNFSSSKGVFNNGDGFSYVISILDVNSENATIQIRKVGKQ